MTAPLICGADPGAGGAIAFVNANTGALEHVHPMPLTKDGKVDATLLAALFNGRNVLRAYVENVSSRPRQAGQFQFGISTGIVHGVLGACQIPLQLVAPASWKGAYGIRRAEDASKRDTKNQARILAQQLFPAMADRFARVKDDGMAEAALLALYGLNLYLTT